MDEYFAWRPLLGLALSLSAKVTPYLCDSSHSRPSVQRVQPPVNVFGHGPFPET